MYWSISDSVEIGAGLLEAKSTEIQGSGMSVELIWVDLLQGLRRWLRAGSSLRLPFLRLRGGHDSAKSMACAV